MNKFYVGLATAALAVFAYAGPVEFGGGGGTTPLNNYGSGSHYDPAAVAITGGSITNVDITSTNIAVTGAGSAYYLGRRDTGALAWMLYSSAGELNFYGGYNNRLSIYDDGRIVINNQYTLPTVGGATNYVMTANGTGLPLTWTAIPASASTTNAAELTIGVLDVARLSNTVARTDISNTYSANTTNNFDTFSFNLAKLSSGSNFISTLGGTSICLGVRSGPLNTAPTSLYIGFGAGETLTSGGYNVGIGWKSLNVAPNNVAQMTCVGYATAGGGAASWGTYIGAQSGQNAGGDYNTFVGGNSGNAVGFSAACSANTAVGYNAIGLGGRKTSHSNAVYGAGAMVLNTTNWIGNTAIGAGAGANMGSLCDGNTFVGWDCAGAAGVWTNAGGFGVGIRPTENNTIIIGNSLNAVAIATNTAAGAKFNVAGSTILGTSGTSFNSIMSVAVSTNFGIVMANSRVDILVALTGATDGDAVALRLPDVPQGLDFSNTYTTNGILILRCDNNTANTITNSADMTYGATVIAY